MRAEPDASPPSTIGPVEASITRYTDTESRIHAFARFDAEQALLLDAALAVTGASGPLARAPIAAPALGQAMSRAARRPECRGLRGALVRTYTVARPRWS